MTLPPPTGAWLLESLVNCAAGTKGDGTDLSTPRDGGKCRTATGDAVPDMRGPTTPPPTKVP